MISIIYLSLPNAYKLMFFFDRNINENRDVKFLECDYLLLQWCVKLTLEKMSKSGVPYIPVFLYVVFTLLCVIHFSSILAPSPLHTRC